MPPPADGANVPLPTAAEVATSYLEVAQRASRLLRRHMKRTARRGIWFPSEDLEVAKAFMDISARLLASPYRIAQTQMAMLRDHIRLCQQSTLRTMGLPAQPVATPDRGDPRFDDKAWEDNFLFDFIKQSYLITARHLHTAVARTEGLDEASQHKLNALTRQYVDAMSPTNFALTNPEVLRETVNSKGKNLVKGLKHLLKDLEAGDRPLHQLTSDDSTYRLGHDLATTPGKVIFQNDLLQLIHTQPAGTHQCQKPLLIVPPWINQYCVLDLRASNSYVKWATEQGLTTFVISWASADQRLSGKSFDDYVVDGVLAAIAAIELATGEQRIDLVGHCLGGTLLMTTLAYMAARRDPRAASATFLGTLIDFSEAGEPGAPASAERTAGAGTKAAQDGAPAHPKMAAMLKMAHTNDLIWSYVVDNYLLGKNSFPVELLAWHADATRLPSALHDFFLETCYHANGLAKAGGISVAGVDIDISSVKVPCYFLATIEDAISPWKSSYIGAHLPSGPVRFVLGESGHVAGVINPPAAKRYGYWTNEAFPEQADEFLGGASRHPGSWWTDWQQWLLAHPDGNTLVAARQPGEGALKPIEDAPGSYATGGLGQRDSP
ncbi:alpha/beta fold hydrolase [Accumulibacter sp.]|uniref:alpha/beta fold hydrolase n=1 Tax=Accumulibacter sp. TaxID=2053492 RepID=UPI0028C40316|nr:alpha/beta fold hydrolase [Accumulibacter sp.]